ncbi:hypothetical protein FRB95_008935 [Tulasnella sp. JGI-2019a]|nr:hypothetical protein FRB95_008935 [Tulasnella sp. JGI-2019a]
MADATTAAQTAATEAFLKDAAYWIRGTQMSFVAWYAVSLWDWIVNLPREWRLIHESPWSAVKVLYLLCRYWVIAGGPWVLFVFIGDHSEDTCNKLWRSPQILAMWNQIWAECVLIVRVYAFWGNSKPLLVAMCTAMLGMVSYQVWCTMHGMALLPFINPPTGPCFPTVTYVGSPLILIFFLLPLIFDSALTGLTVYRMFQLRRQTAGHAASPLMKTFVREGLYYFVVIAAANLVNAIFYFQPKQTMSALNIPLSVYFPDILACRLILDLREKGKASGNSPNPTASYSHSHRRVGPKIPIPSRKPENDVDLKDAESGAITAMGFTNGHELETFEGTRSKRVTIVAPNGHTHHEDETSDVDDAKYDVDEIASTASNNGRGIRVDVESHHYYEPSDNR